jgi:hypothetical protein
MRHDGRIQTAILPDDPFFPEYRFDSTVHKVVQGRGSVSFRLEHPAIGKLLLFLRHNSSGTVPGQSMESVLGFP